MQSRSITLASNGQVTFTRFLMDAAPRATTCRCSMKHGRSSRLGYNQISPKVRENLVVKPVPNPSRSRQSRLGILSRPQSASCTTVNGLRRLLLENTVEIGLPAVFYPGHCVGTRSFSLAFCPYRCLVPLRSAQTAKFLFDRPLILV